MDKFNEGFCKTALWPLLHSFTAYAKYSDKDWHNYLVINKHFCDEIEKILLPGDIVWVQDYQLMLLPDLLRQRFPELLIGFYLQTPFPSSEVLDFIPTTCRIKLLEGMLGADLIGFHNEEFKSNFLNTLSKDNLSMQRSVKPYPMGVNLEFFQKKEANNKLRPTKIIDKTCFSTLLSINHLDYTKGIINQIKAYEMFLINNPEWHCEIVFRLIVAPSKYKMHCYKQLQQKINTLVEYINNKYGNLSWMPIVYYNKNYDIDHLIEFYKDSDICLVTPLRDGMSLTAKEYIAARSDHHGVLILSETAGAAPDLSDAIMVNAHSINDMATAIKFALDMDETEKVERMQSLKSQIKKSDIDNCGSNFLNDLINLSGLSLKINSLPFDEIVEEELTDMINS